MQQMHMSHQQYDMAQQAAQQDQQQHYEAHVGHKREADDADCERPNFPLAASLAPICHFWSEMKHQRGWSARVASCS